MTSPKAFPRLKTSPNAGKSGVVVPLYFMKTVLLTMWYTFLCPGDLASQNNVKSPLIRSQSRVGDRCSAVLTRYQMFMFRLTVYDKPFCSSEPRVFKIRVAKQHID